MPVLTSSNSIDNLEIGWLLKGKLKSCGINTIEDLNQALDNNALPYGKEKTVETLQKALNHYKDSSRLRIVVVDKGKEGKMEIKTKPSKSQYTERESSSSKKEKKIKPIEPIKPSINRYDIANIMLDIVVELANDHDIPKYRLEKYPSFPSYDVFFDNKLIYIRFEKLEELLEEKLKGYDIISTATNQKPIFMATTFLKQDSPLYSNVKNGKLYCFSSYKHILPVDYKYVRFYIDRLENKYNIKIDLSMNDDLQEEWVQEKARMDAEREEQNKGLFPEIDSEFEEKVIPKWEPSLRGLAETYALNKDYEEAINVCIDYTRSYVTAKGSYKDIENDVLAKLIDYKNRTKDKGLKNNTQILINDIQEDMKEDNPVVEVKPDTMKTLESVLEKDLSKLPEDMREEISRELLDEPVEQKQNNDTQESFIVVTQIPSTMPGNIIINSCSPVYGNMVVLIFTVVVSVEHKSQFDFKNQVYTGTYQFDTNNINNGLLAIDPGAGDADALRARLIEMINNLK